MRSEVDSFSTLSGWLPLETLHISACHVQYVCVLEIEIDSLAYSMPMIIISH